MKVYYGKDDVVLAYVGNVFKENPDTMFGPIFIGVILDFFFVGILVCQITHYFRVFPRDSPWIKWLVSCTTILSLIKLFQTFMIVWDKNIMGFGDWKNAADFHWNMWIDPPAAALLSLSAQVFFVWRCFVLMNQNWWLLAGLLTMCLSVLGLSAVVSIRYRYDPFYIQAIRPLTIPMLVISVLIFMLLIEAVDIVITIIVLWKLTKSRGRVSQTTDSMLMKLVAITWEAALPPSLSAITSLVLYLTMGSLNSWFTIFHLLTPRLYVFSLLFTLNSRDTVRLAGSSASSQIKRSRQQYDSANINGNPFALHSLSKDRKSQSICVPQPIQLHVQRNTIKHESGSI